MFLNEAYFDAHIIPMLAQMAQIYFFAIKNGGISLFRIRYFSSLSSMWLVERPLTSVNLAKSNISKSNLDSS